MLAAYAELNVALWLLDLFSGGGGAGEGYRRAGFNIVGIELNECVTHPEHQIIRTDAIAYLKALLDSGRIAKFRAVHASPPCQAYSRGALKSNHAIGTVDYVQLVRTLLQRMHDEFGIPYVIENVVGSPLYKHLLLAGPMFDLNVVRKRYFEFGPLDLAKFIPQPSMPRLKPKIWVRSKHMSLGVRPVRKSQYCIVAGNGGDGFSRKLKDWQDAMGIDWLPREELTQAIPPAYTQYIGEHLRKYLWLTQHEN